MAIIYEKLEQMYHLESGVGLIAAPTGSGKTHSVKELAFNKITEKKEILKPKKKVKKESEQKESEQLSLFDSLPELTDEDYTELNYPAIVYLVDKKNSVSEVYTETVDRIKKTNPKDEKKILICKPKEELTDMLLGVFSDKKNTYSMNNISVSDKPFKENQVATLRIIKDKEEYKDERDLYFDVTSNKVQHITSLSLEGVSDSEFKAIILNSLASLYFQTLTNFDFGEFGNLSELNNWTFYIPVWAEQLVNNRKSLVGLKTLEIKDGQLNYYIQDVADMFWLIATPSDVVERLNFDFEFAFTTPNFKWGIVSDTGFGTSLDIEAIHEEAKILKKEKEAIGDGKFKRALASVDAIDEFFPSVFNSGYTLKYGWYYYYSNKRGRGINQKNKMTTKPRLHSFCADGISSEEMELLLKFMNHPLLRGGELSIAPVPVKMLRHHKF